jgi:hypothetical protein
VQVERKGRSQPELDHVSLAYIACRSNLLDRPVDSEGQRFKGRFQVMDRATGEPVAATSVRVRSTDGQYLTGQTDSDGYTQWVERDANEALAFDLQEADA